MSLFPEDNRLTPRRGIDIAQGPERYRGFTLIELLVAITVAIVIATIAVPNFQAFAARNQVNAEVMRIRTALAMARNTAITRRTIITVCPSTNQLSCTTSEGWLGPLTIFEGDGNPGDTLLRTLGESRALKLTYRSDNRPVRYDALGHSTWHNGTFRLCGQQGEGAKIIVSNLGRVRRKREAPSNC